MATEERGLQQVIYADVLVLINTVVTFIILLSVKVLSDANTNAVRMFAASVMGGLYALILLAPPIVYFLLFLSKAFVCLLIAFIAFRCQNVKAVLKKGMLVLLLTYSYGGALYAVKYFLQASFLTMHNGVFYFDLNAYGLIAIFVVFYFVVFIIKKYVFNKSSTDMIYELTLIHKEKEVRIKALFDSGNSIKDIYYNQPVVIACKNSILPLLCGQITNNGSDDMLPHEASFRLLPVKSLSGESVLPAFTAERVIVSGDDIHKTKNNVCIALTKDPLGEKLYSALINETMIN